MINPLKITNYRQTEAGLQESILFWILAAGKNGLTAANCLESLLNSWRKKTPFKTIVHINNSTNLAEEMKRHGIGCYNHKSKSFLDLISKNLDLKTCSVDELESVRGIGPKTARCFLIHSRKNQRYAGIDTHLLKFMRDMNYETPKSTPSGKKYKELEGFFLRLCDQVSMKPADLDLLVWNAYSGNIGEPRDVLSLFA